MDNYTLWKSDLARAGKTPADMVKLVRDVGMTEYADQLEAVISEMEAQSEEPA